ncbi:MAG TPA: substrate-binding domain-containing protein [Thermoplasmata archaeon]|nr:substrate-binding domain-containing protein [Thermoplasmata archaeon]
MSMSRQTTVLLVGFAAIVLLAAGFAGGWLARGPGSSSNTNSSVTPPASVNTFTLIGAGSLNVVLPPLITSFAAQEPGILAPAASQTYEGSIAALHAISQTHEAFDVAVAADYRLIPQILEPTYASWELLFAADPVVLAYNPSVPAFSGLNGSNWAADLQKPGVALGVSNASTDPLGYAAIFALQLEGQLLNGSTSAVYSHFFTGAPGALAVPVSGTTKLASETQASTYLSGGTVQAFLVYQSYAKSAGLTFLSLPWQVNLGSDNATALTDYAKASTSIVGTNSTLQKVTGSPVLFAATVPSNAPNPELGQLFLAYLVSAPVATQLAAAGFLPLAVPWTDQVSNLPDALAATTQALPASLAAGIT